MLKPLHALIRRAFLSVGFRWEERRIGDLKLGFWRIPLRKRPRSASAGARRFVLMPGLGDTAVSWLGVFVQLVPALRREGYDEAVLVDFPGFSGFLSDEKCFPSMDLLVSAVCDALDSLQPTLIFGHSLGGWLGARYAAECGSGARPAQGQKKRYTGPEKLVVCNPSGVFGSADDKKGWTARFQKGIDEGFGSFGKHVFHKQPIWFPYVAKGFIGFMEREDVLQFLYSVREDHELEARLGQMKAKTWVFWGEHDTLALAKWAQDWLKHLPQGARSVVIPGSGHSPHFEQPRLTARELRSVIAD